MAKKRLTEEQQQEIKLLLASNEMFERTKKEVETRGDGNIALKQIEEAQSEVVDKIKAIDPDALSNVGKKKVQEDLFKSSDVSLMDLMKDKYGDQSDSFTNRNTNKRKEEVVEKEERIIPSEPAIVGDTAFNNVDDTMQYDIIELPSNGQCYKSKIDRVPVGYLTAYDENIITSPNLYKDGLVIDYLLRNKVMNKDIDVDELVSGDADAIILYLRATSYGADFPIVVTDDKTGEQFESTVDLTTIKPKQFTLIGDENGYFTYTTPVRKHEIKFRYLTRRQEKLLQKMTELESNGAKSRMLKSESDTIKSAIINDTLLTTVEKETLNKAVKVIDEWSKKLSEVNNSEVINMMTNNMEMQIVSVNGNTDREFIKKYVRTMPAGEALALRKYINDHKPGIDFNITVERPESLGGGSMNTFFYWDDTIFLNIPNL